MKVVEPEFTQEQVNKINGAIKQAISRMHMYVKSLQVQYEKTPTMLTGISFRKIMLEARKNLNSIFYDIDTTKHIDISIKLNELNDLPEIVIAVKSIAAQSELIKTLRVKLEGKLIKGEEF